MLNPILYYREFAPCEALRDQVGAFFSTVPARTRGRTPRYRLIRGIVFGEQDSFSAPFFADGQVSLTVSFDHACGADGRWYGGVAPAASVIGAMSIVGPARPADRPAVIGAYFQPGQAARFLGVPSELLTDQIVPLEDLWGRAACEPLLDLCDTDEAARVERLERALLERLGRAQRRKSAVDSTGLARCVVARGGRVSIGRMAELAGVSRQALTRTFRAEIGVTPKVYCMLARFQSGLAFTGRADAIDWASVAVDLGYADQSHMIAEFRRFSSLTPHEFASRKWFHPFIERAKARAGIASVW